MDPSTPVNIIAPPGPATPTAAPPAQPSEATVTIEAPLIEFSTQPTPSTPKEALLGAFAQATTPSAECVELCTKHKADAEKILKKTFFTWNPVQMRTLVVNGLNYDVKIDAGQEFVHVRIYQPIGEPSELTNCQGGFKADSPFEGSFPVSKD